MITEACRAGKHEWQVVDGALGKDECTRCQLIREHTPDGGVSYGTPLPRALTAIESHEHVGDARAQLWVAVYTHELTATRAVFRQHPPPDFAAHPLRSDVMLVLQKQASAARQYACDAANAAVRDFDEHYLGGKRA